MPVTFWTFMIGSLALAGIVPARRVLVQGRAPGRRERHRPPRGSSWMFLATARDHRVLHDAHGAADVLRGRSAGTAHPHESPPSMTGPLVFLAVGDVGVGFLGAPQLGAVFGDWVFFEASARGGTSSRGSRCSRHGRRAARHRRRMAALPRPARSAIRSAALGPVWTLLRTAVLHRRLLHARRSCYPIRDQVSAARLLVQPARARRRRERRRGCSPAGLGRVVIGRPQRGRRRRERAPAASPAPPAGCCRYLQSGNVQWYAVVLFVGVIALTIVFVRIA